MTGEMHINQTFSEFEFNRRMCVKTSEKKNEFRTNIAID